MSAARSSPERSAASSSASAVSVAFTNLRDTADFDVAELVASTRSPTGSSPTGYLRVASPASIRSIAIPPRTSVPLNASYDGTGSSPEPSAARIRGRRTGTRRPPKVTEPSSLPCRVAARAGSCCPFGPHTATTSAAIIAAITCNPAPTARANSPSRTSPAISPNAMLTCSGTACAPASVVSFWLPLPTAVPFLECSWRSTRVPTPRQVSGGGPPPRAS